MDHPELPETLKAAGAEYYVQLKALGLHPEGLLWMLEQADNQFVLWMIWSGVDHYGPFALSKMLFKAYRASALTQEIDPFLVRAKSPKQVTADVLARSMSESVPETGMSMQGARIVPTPFGRMATEQDPGFYWRPSWVYHWQERKRKRMDVSRDWHRFTENVDRLAA